MKFLSLSSITSVMGTLFAPVTAFAQGLTGSPSFAGTADGDLGIVLTNMINWVLLLVGLIAAIMLVYGGFRYIISRGDEDEAADAKNTILYAIIGLVVIGLAAVVVNYVVSVIQAA